MNSQPQPQDPSVYPEIPEYKDSGEESVQGDVPEIENEADFIQRVKRRNDAYKGDYNSLKEIADKNREYYRGNQVTSDDLYIGEDKIVVNKIFQSLETIIPIVTRKTPEPDVTLLPQDNRGLQLQEKLEAFLKNQWEIEQKMQPIIEEVLRNLFCGRYGAIKYSYDTETNEMVFGLVPMNKLAFKHKTIGVQEAPCIIEYVTKSLGEIEKIFPDKYTTLKEALEKNDDSVNEDTEINYIEYWENERYGCVYLGAGNEICLHMEKNPNYNFDNKEKNYFKEPKKPYIFLNFLSFGDSIIDDTSLVDQVLTLQDSVNERKRQINLNARLANGKMVVAGNKIDKESFEQLSNDPLEKVYLPGQDTAQGAIEYNYGRSMDNGVYNDMTDTKNEIDNVMGTHSTTRGERVSNETATGRAILKDSDTGRLEIVSRRIEIFAQECYDAMFQMIRIFGTDKLPVHYKISEEGRLSQFEKQSYIYSKDFDDYTVQILVQSGSTVPRDKMTQKAEAVDLWKAGGMSTVDMYRILEYSDPEKLARNAYLEKTNPAALYENGLEGISIEAIEHIDKLIEGEKIELFKTKDLNNFAKYIQTFVDYLKGAEIDDRILSYTKLNLSTQKKIIEHLQEEKEILDEMTREKEEDEAGNNTEVTEQMDPATGAPLNPLVTEQTLPTQPAQNIPEEDTAQLMASQGLEGGANGFTPQPPAALQPEIPGI